MILNPLDWRGPTFLGFYLLLLLLALAAGFLIRYLYTSPGGAPPEEAAEFDGYQASYLTGGPRAVVRTALAMLIRRGSCGLNFEGRLRNIDKLPGDAHPIERWAYIAIARSMRLSWLRHVPVLKTFVSDKPVGQHALQFVWQKARELPPALAASLERHELIVSGTRHVLARVMPALIFGGLAALGVAKIGVGLDRQRPVAILVVLTLITAVIGLIFLGWPARVTRRGKQTRYLLDEAWEDLRTAGRHSNIQLPMSEAAMAVALFGLTAISGDELRRLKETLQPVHNTTMSGCGSGGSSCGGGGGGCGGGGCGGGGCGGCGS